MDETVPSGRSLAGLNVNSLHRVPMGRAEDDMDTSGTEDFVDLFGVEVEASKPVERLIEYHLPSSGAALTVQVVGHHVLWVRRLLQTSVGLRVVGESSVEWGPVDERLY